MQVLANLWRTLSAGFVGVLVATAVALAATGAVALLAVGPTPLSRIPISPIVLAILAGLALSGAARDRPHWSPGLQFTARSLLRFAVVLIGLRLSLVELGALGLQALPLVAGALASGLGLAWLLGRLFGLGPKLIALLAVGSAVCGVSAIGSLAPALKARAEETAYAVTCIALFGLVAALIYPWLLHGWLADGRQAGLVLGASIQDTAQVTAAAMLYEQSFGQDQVLASATVTKLLRNLTMLAVIPAAVAWALRSERTAGARPAFPWFILGFLALAAARSAGDLLVGDSQAWHGLLDAASVASAFLFTMAMAAIGMGVRVEALRTLGPGPAVVAVVAAVGMGLTAVLLVRVLG